MRYSPLPIALAAVTATLFMSGAAHAEEGAFHGPRLAVIGGIDWTDNAPNSGATTGALIGAQAGYDFDLGTFVIGAEADIQASTSSRQFATFRSTSDRYLTLAARLGVKPTDNTLVYVKGGYSNAQISFTPGTTALGRRFNGDGYHIAAGGEAIITGRVFAKAEYRFSDYGNTVRGQQIVTGVGIRF